MLRDLNVGDTLKATVTLADYPASAGWVLNYRLTPRAGGAAYSFASTASGDDFAILVAAATTAAWVAGAYSVTAWVSKGAERYSIASETGQLTLSPDPATLPVGTDTRSQARKNLEAIRAKLGGKATDAVNRYAIAGREMAFYSVPELIRLEAFWAAQVAAEDAAAGIANPRGQGRRIFMAVR